MSSHAQLLTSLENRHGVFLHQDFVVRHLSDKKMAESANWEEQIYNVFLETDIIQSSIPVIPPDFGQLHDVLFPDSSKGIVLQINNIIDIENSAQSLLNTITVSNPVRQVYQQAPTESNAPVNFPRGTLKLEVTDGYRQITALEVKRIASLSMNVPIGAKVSRGVSQSAHVLADHHSIDSYKKLSYSSWNIDDRAWELSAIGWQSIVFISW